jgi:phage shock protein PspC (stress-responsive transcriptional regulator)
MIGGVCAGIAQRLDVEPWLIRVIWLGSVLCFGTGLLLYAMVWLCVPRSDDAENGLGNMILGVCARIGRRGDVDVAVARIVAVLLLFASGGTAIVGYVLLYFLLPEKPQERLSSPGDSPL